MTSPRRLESCRYGYPDFCESILNLLHSGLTIDYLNSRFQLLKKLLAELCDLRGDDGAAVGLGGVVVEVVLVVVLSRVERLERRDLCDDGRVPETRAVEFCD